MAEETAPSSTPEGTPSSKPTAGKSFWNTFFRRESLLQEAVDGKLRCNVCERRCLIAPGAMGWCNTRHNQDGRLWSLIYGAVSSLGTDPIEKKPFYHFYPGTLTFTAGSWSCNFACPWCQNWDIARVSPPYAGERITPQRYVAMAENAECQSISLSYNEPTLALEWAVEVLAIAQKRGLPSTFVTNGYMTPEALELLIAAGLNAMNVDIKGDAPTVKQYCKGVEMEKVWAACRVARAHNLHVEITTLVIPGVNDDETILSAVARRIVTDLGPDTPWHISGYHPAYRFVTPRTSLETLKQARHIGQEAGLRYVYLGNIADPPHNHTYCPQCGRLVIRRLGFQILSNTLKQGRCPHCQQAIAGVF